MTEARGLTDAVTRTLLRHQIFSAVRQFHEIFSALSQGPVPVTFAPQRVFATSGILTLSRSCYLACTHDMTWTMVSIWWMLWFLTHKCSQIKQPRWLLPLLKTWHVPVLTSTEEMKTYILNVTPSWQRGWTDFPWCAFLHPHLCTG